MPGTVASGVMRDDELAGRDRDDLDERVSDSDRVNLIRNRHVSDRLLCDLYPYARNEQAAIRHALQDLIRWYDAGVLPFQLVGRDSPGDGLPGDPPPDDGDGDDGLETDGGDRQTSLSEFASSHDDE